MTSRCSSGIGELGDVVDAVSYVQPLLDHRCPFVVFPAGVAVVALVADLVGEDLPSCVEYCCGDCRDVCAEGRQRIDLHFVPKFPISALYNQAA